MMISGKEMITLGVEVVMIISKVIRDDHLYGGSGNDQIDEGQEMIILNRVRADYITAGDGQDYILAEEDMDSSRVYFEAIEG